MDEYKLVKRYLEKNKVIRHTNVSNKKWLYSILSKTLISILLLISSLCIIKVNSDFKLFIKKNVYDTNISFAKINEVYKKYFGKIYPIDELISDYKSKQSDMVFNENLTYKSKENYKEGVKLIVSTNYLVPVQESGIVVYEGDKDNYGYTIIIQQVNGIDLWYVGVKNSNLKLYDYIEKGSLLGEASSNEIYLFYQKNGEFVDYKEYLL